MKKLEFCQNTFDIDPHGILIWSKLNTAIVSDLHLEKGSSYAKYGQYIPPYDLSLIHISEPTRPY